MNGKVIDLSRERAARHSKRMTFNAPLDALTYARQQLDVEVSRQADVLFVSADEFAESMRVARGLINACIDAHVRAARQRQEQQQ